MLRTSTLFLDSNLISTISRLKDVLKELLFEGEKMPYTVGASYQSLLDNMQTLMPIIK